MERILNPSTGRLVNANGKIGKSILNQLNNENHSFQNRYNENHNLNSEYNKNQDEIDIIEISIKDHNLSLMLNELEYQKYLNQDEKTSIPFLSINEKEKLINTIKDKQNKISIIQNQIIS